MKFSGILTTLSRAFRNPDEAIYYDRHAVCPECGGDDLETTCMATLFDGSVFIDPNHAGCVCGWSGRVHELVPAKEP